MVECAASSVASDLLFLLIGNPPASVLASDSLIEALHVDPDGARRLTGLVPRAMAFLASSEIIVTPSSERFTGCMLSTLAKKNNYNPPQTRSRLLDSNVYRKGQEYCQICFYANSLRSAIKTLRRLNVCPLRIGGTTRYGNRSPRPAAATNQSFARS